jgi:hypothetical protein
MNPHRQCGRLLEVALRLRKLLKGSLSDPRVERLNTGRCEIGNISRHYHHPMDEGCRGNEAVTNGTQVGHMQ